MTREEFSLFERACKAIWRELAETGANNKTDFARWFFAGCPACQIASSCGLCAIIAWRDRNCVSGSYGLWEYAYDASDRKKYASQIAALEWGWMPEYEQVVIEPELIQKIKEHLSHD